MEKTFFQKTKRFLKRNAAPFAVGGIFSIISYILYLNLAPSQDGKSLEQVERFRNWLAFRRGQGVWYDMDSFKKFIDTFDRLVPKARNIQMEREHRNPSYKWVVGFYWKRTPDPDDNKKVKYNFCIVPTLVKDGVVIDYFEDFKLKETHLQHYYHRFDTLKRPGSGPTTRADADDSTNSYDNGHLWP
jgi:hypothetical protein